MRRRRLPPSQPVSPFLFLALTSLRIALGGYESTNIKPDSLHSYGGARVIMLTS